MPDVLQNVSDFPKIARLSERVHRILGMNPSPFTGPGTNTYLVGMNTRFPVLIDTGIGKPEWRELLEGHLEECGSPQVTRCLMTHAHPDHIGGAGDLRELFPEAQLFKHAWPEVDGSNGLEAAPISDGDMFWEGEDFMLKAVHSPGHAPDHICFHLVDEEENALFTGDVVLGVGTTVIPRAGGDLAVYLETLRRLLELNVKRIYPGHGPVIDNPREKIEFYLNHRLEREQQILTELQGGVQTVVAIVKSIYREYPENLHAAAGQSVSAHLDKLENEGRVARTEDDPPIFSLKD
ncbi:MAG: MBL fold metallo-hydrolase [bacterium]